jgi:magnesium-transporting ATPase (P-type)
MDVHIYAYICTLISTICLVACLRRCGSYLSTKCTAPINLILRFLTDAFMIKYTFSHLSMCFLGSVLWKSSNISGCAFMQLTQEAETLLGTHEPTQLVIDGKTLTQILKDDDAEASLAKLGSLCTAVVVCRASPSQKARIVAMMREYEIRIVTDPHRTRIGRWLARHNRNLGVRAQLVFVKPSMILPSMLYTIT